MRLCSKSGTLLKISEQTRWKYEGCKEASFTLEKDIAEIDEEGWEEGEYEWWDTTGERGLRGEEAVEDKRGVEGRTSVPLTNEEKEVLDAV